jgi:hypothetical protein
MQRLRRYRWLALSLALWMFKKAQTGDYTVLCTSVGMKLVNLDGKTADPASKMGHSALDCPGCLAQLASAPPPVVQTLAALEPAFYTPDFLSPSFASREALTASARGPPALG